MAIYKDMALRDAIYDAGAIGAHLEYLAGLHEEYPAGINAALLCQLAVQHQMTILPMNGHKVLGADEVDQQLELFLAGMSRDVHVEQLIVEYVRPQAEQVVEGAIDHLLIAGDGGCRDDDGIAGNHANRARVALPHAHQG